MLILIAIYFNSSILLKYCEVQDSYTPVLSRMQIKGHVGARMSCLNNIVIMFLNDVHANKQNVVMLLLVVINL